MNSRHRRAKLVRTRSSGSGQYQVVLLWVWASLRLLITYFDWGRVKCAFTGVDILVFLAVLSFNSSRAMSKSAWNLNRNSLDFIVLSQCGSLRSKLSKHASTYCIVSSLDWSCYDSRCRSLTYPLTRSSGVSRDIIRSIRSFESIGQMRQLILCYIVYSISTYTIKARIMRLAVLLCTLVFVAQSTTEILIQGSTDTTVSAVGVKFSHRKTRPHPDIIVENLPGKGIRVEVCIRPGTSIPQTVLSQLQLQRIRQKGIKSESGGECYRYNFWYQSPTDDVFVQRIDEHVRSLGNTHSSLVNNNLTVKKADTYQIQANFDDHVQGMSILFAKPVNITLSSSVKYTESKGVFSLRQGQIVQSVGFYNRSLEGTGFHQTVNVEITLKSGIKMSEGCRMVIQEQMSDKYYIDVDQFTLSNSSEVINIEKPTTLSKQYQVQLVLPIALNKTSVTASYPIHIRYQKPSNSDYAKIVLSPLRSLTIRCPKGQQQAQYYFSEIKTPMASSTKIPVGKIEDKNIVFVVTIVITFYAGMLIRKGVKNN